MGSLLRSSHITIWTDVDGVYSADPRKVPEAVCLPGMTYHEAWEMSYFGANVLHPRTALPAMKYKIPVSIKNFFNQVRIRFTPSSFLLLLLLLLLIFPPPPPPPPSHADSHYLATLATPLF